MGKWLVALRGQGLPVVDVRERLGISGLLNMVIDKQQVTNFRVFCVYSLLNTVK